MANLAIFANKNRHRMNKYILCVDIFEPLFQRLESCDNLNELYNITVCLTFLNRIITVDLMNVHNTKIEQLVESGQLNGDSDTAIILAVMKNINTEINLQFSSIHSIISDCTVLEYGTVVIQEHSNIANSSRIAFTSHRKIGGPRIGRCAIGRCYCVKTVDTRYANQFFQFVLKLFYFTTDLRNPL